MRTFPRALRPALWLLLSSPLLAQGEFDNESKIPAPLPHFDTEAKTEFWIPPAKPGSTPTDFSQLTLAERDAMNMAQNQPGLRGAKPEAASMDGQKFEIVSRDWMQHFQLDQSADGTLWAFGGSYKASFDAQGAEYVPFLGSSAPRNFPLEMRLESISLGGEPLGFETDVAPTFQGDSAVYARGSVQERYDLSVGQIEQLFVFDSLPGNGELIVRMDVLTELVGKETGQGFEFAGPYGSVLYGFATVLDAAGNSAAAPTALIPGGIEIRVPASFIAAAQMPLTIDPVLSTFDINSDSSDDVHPDVAYDLGAAAFLVCWERIFSASDHDVWAELRSPLGGTLLANSGAYIDFTTSSWIDPRVANNRIASQFLVVATRKGTVDEIWGRTRQATSTNMTGAFQISTGSGDKGFPDVGGDPHTVGPTYYCVVWERIFALNTDHDIHARLVDAGSGLVGTSAILINNTGGSIDRNPSVSNSNGIPSAATQEWNISWERGYNASDWDILGAQVHWDGTITTSSFFIDFSSDHDRYPASSSPLNYQGAGPRVWMVVYQKDTISAGPTIYAKCYRGLTTFAIEDIGSIDPNGQGNNKHFPDVDTNGKQFIVAWSEPFNGNFSDLDVYAGTFYLAGHSIHASEARTNLAFSSSTEREVRVCARNSSGLTSDWAMLVWTDGTTTVGDIEGAIFDTRDNYGSDIGVSYCSQSTPNSAGKTAFLHATGSANAGGDPLHLQAYDMPLNQFGIFLGSPHGTSSFIPPGSQGFFCIGQPFGRFNLPSQIGFSGSLGKIDIDIDTNAMPLGSQTTVFSGDTWTFQAWYRDNNPNQVSNFTDAVSVTFF